MMSSMLSIRKFFRSKLRSSEKEGQHGKDTANCSSVRTVINEEYREAFRTKSYTEICDKIKGQIETGITLDDANSFSSSPPPSPPPATTEHVHLSEYLVEPRRETLVSISESSKNHHFLINYFHISLEAGRICEFILQNAHQLRVDYDAIRSVIEFIEQKPDYKIWNHNQHNGIYRNLASFAHHTNPFSSMTKEKFHELHDIHHHLFHQLTSKCEKTKRKKKFMRCIKRALKIVGCGALAIALLLLAMHSVVGVVATAPGLIMSSFAMKKLKRAKRESKKSKQHEGLETQLDVAAKGIYVLINDFDTMSRLVQRLHDEMEHRKLAAETCVRKGKKEALKRVVTDFQMHEYCFLEQLEELEKQIYLCFLDINRSRRLLIQELDK